MQTLLSFRATALSVGALIVLLSVRDLCARDVNIDAIYLKQSPLLTRIVDTKLDLFSRAGATLAADDVAFAGWKSGDSIVFCRESDGKTLVQEIYLPTRGQRHIANIPGAPLCVSVTGRYCLTKSAQANLLSVKPFFSVLDMTSGNVKSERTGELFLDFSISPFGSSYLRDTKDGITEYFPDSSRNKTLIRRELYSNQIKPGHTVTPFLSPDGGKIAVVIGGGGSYHALVYDKGALIRDIPGISSAGEFAWIDSSTIVYRNGSPGYYRLVLISLADNLTREVLRRTLNTNFSYCPANGLLVALEDGCITFRAARSSLIETYPLEGEDPLFSPNGNSLATLYAGKLFIVNREVMKKKLIEMKRTAGKLLELYREAKRTDSLWENDFTAEYLDRKIELYHRLTD
ncbi:MAG TPA: hypothetical protein VF857_04250 [Spirochaetota bacterium]